MSHYDHEATTTTTNDPKTIKPEAVIFNDIQIQFFARCSEGAASMLSESRDGRERERERKTKTTHTLKVKPETACYIIVLTPAAIFLLGCCCSQEM